MLLQAYMYVHQAAAATTTATITTTKRLYFDTLRYRDLCDNADLFDNKVFFCVYAHKIITTGISIYYLYPIDYIYVFYKCYVQPI